MNKDKIRGVLYGVAVGDALGSHFEGWRAKDINRLFGTVSEMQDLESSIWASGEYTDDTELTLATAKAYKSGKFNVDDAAEAMVKWMQTNAKGIGILTNRALSYISSCRHTPLESGKVATAAVGPKKAAGNGSLMRCASTAIVREPHDEKIVDESVVLSEITHADPRCTASCVAYNIILSAMLRDIPLSDVLFDMYLRVGKIDGKTATLVKNVFDGGTPQLTHYSTGGYVLYALEKALYELPSESYEDSIIRVVNEGGDVDTNAAIVGGLVGGRLGFNSIPKRWIDGLKGVDAIEMVVDNLEIW